MGYVCPVGFIISEVIRNKMSTPDAGVTETVDCERGNTAANEPTKLNQAVW